MIIVMEGQHGDIKYPGKERRGVSVNIGGLGGLCLLVSIFSSPESTITLSTFALATGMPCEACFLVLPRSGESEKGLRICGLWRKQACGPNGSLRRLWILESSEIPTS